MEFALYFFTYVIVFTSVITILGGKSNMTMEWVTLIAAIIGAITSLVIAFLQNRKGYKDLDRNDKDLSKEHGGLSKEHGGLSKEHEGLSKEHERLSKEHERLSKEHAIIMESQQTIESRREKQYDKLEAELRNVTSFVIEEKALRDKAGENGFPLQEVVSQITHTAQLYTEATAKIVELQEVNRKLVEKATRLEQENQKVKERCLSLFRQLDNLTLEQQQVHEEEISQRDDISRSDDIDYDQHEFDNDFPDWEK